MVDWSGPLEGGNTLRVRVCPVRQRCRLVYGRHRMVTIKVHQGGMVRKTHGRFHALTIRMRFVFQCNNGDGKRDVKAFGLVR